jgi:hypothetical protein
MALERSDTSSSPQEKAPSTSLHAIVQPSWLAFTAKRVEKRQIKAPVPNSLTQLVLNVPKTYSSISTSLLGSKYMDMTRVLSLASFLALASGIALGDSIVLTDGAVFANMPLSISNPGPGTGCGATSNCGTLGTGPYWDNLSSEGPKMNVGFFLTGSCGISGDCNTDYDPLQYLSQNNGTGQPNAPTDISLQASGSDLITLLANYTGDTTITLGYYNTSNPSVLHSLFGPGSLTSDVGDSLSLSITNGAGYGFYITRSCQNDFAGCSDGYTTWYSNASMDTTDVGDQHFAIFNSTTPGVFYVGIEDWGLAAGPGFEGLGDYNDIMFEVSLKPVATPEPGALGLIGGGLVSIGLARLLARKNRA